MNDDLPTPPEPDAPLHGRPVVRLKPKAEARAIRHGFPWVYADELVTDRRTQSLAPGALPSGTDAAGALVVHALDTRLAVQRDLTATEALYARAGGHV